jgi:hypothetical protein
MNEHATDGETGIKGQAVPLEAGESVIWSRRANHTVGWRAVGGKLYLTDRRLVFRPHVLERTLFFGKEWSAPRTEVASFDVQPRGGANPFDGSLRSRLRVALRQGEPQLFVVPKPDDVAQELSDKLAPRP